MGVDYFLFVLFYFFFNRFAHSLFLFIGLILFLRFMRCVKVSLSLSPLVDVICGLCFLSRMSSYPVLFFPFAYPFSFESYSLDMFSALHPCPSLLLLLLLSSVLFFFHLSAFLISYSSLFFRCPPYPFYALCFPFFPSSPFVFICLLSSLVSFPVCPFLSRIPCPLLQCSLFLLLFPLPFHYYLPLL